MYKNPRKSRTLFQGHDIDLSKQWLREEVKFRASHEMMSSSNTDHFPGFVQKALDTDTGSEDKVPHIGIISNSRPSKGGAEDGMEVYSVCITPNRDIHSSIRVNGSSNSSNLNGEQSNFIFANILDRFSETGHELKDVTSNIPHFYDAWCLFKDNSSDKFKSVSCPYEKRQRFTLNEDKALRYVDIFTHVMTIGNKSEPTNTNYVRIQKTHVVYNNRVIHETVTINNRKDNVPNQFTVTTNLVPTSMQDMDQKIPNNDLLQSVADGDMVESVTMMGFERPLVVYNTVKNVSLKMDFAWRALNGLREFVRSSSSNGEVSTYVKSCIQELKKDMDNMNHIKYIIQLPLTKVILIPGDNTDILAVVSHSVLP